jgi:hypothetical protein
MSCAAIIVNQPMAMEREEAGVDEDAPLRAQPAASGRWQMRQAMCAV